MKKHVKLKEVMKEAIKKILSERVLNIWKVYKNGKIFNAQFDTTAMLDYRVLKKFFGGGTFTIWTRCILLVADI